VFGSAVSEFVQWVRENHGNQGIWTIVRDTCPGIPDYGLAPDVDDVGG